MQEVCWERLKASELRALAEAGAVVIIPVAAIEQHGPHLPTMTDTRIGHALAVRAAEKAYPSRPTVVTPVVWSGLSEHHMAFGGTLTLRVSTFLAILEDLVKALLRHGFRDILISNSHGGNMGAIQQAAASLAMETGAHVVATTYINEAATEIGGILEDQAGIHHACEGETSMMLALEPDLVGADLAGAKNVVTGSYTRAGKGSYRWRPFGSVTPNGTVGDPTRATAVKGEALLAAISDALAAMIADPATWADE